MTRDALHPYYILRFALASAGALLVFAMISTGIRSALRSWYLNPALGVLADAVVLLFALACAVPVAAYGVPRAFDHLVRKVGLARWFPNRLALGVASNREYRIESRLRCPRVWAEAARVTGTKSVSMSDAARTITTFPRVRTIALGPAGVVSDVRVAEGTAPSDWEADRLASALGQERVKIAKKDERTLTITVLTRDPASKLARTLPFAFPTSPVDPTVAVQLGVRGDGSALTLPVFGRQLLIVSASGAGKSGVVAGVLGGLAPAIHAGTVRAYGIDLKGGVEHTLLKALFARISTTWDDAAATIFEVESLLERRTDAMRRAGSRLHRPTTDEPYILLVIDEAASLAYLARDRRAAEQMNAALKRILSAGRATGIAVVAALQDPRKEALATRDLFTHVVGLRMRSQDDAILALGRNAYDSGATCELIPSTQPGRGYLIDDETGEVVEFRTAWVTDDDLRRLNSTYPAPTEPNEKDTQ